MQKIVTWVIGVALLVGCGQQATSIAPPSEEQREPTLAVMEATSGQVPESTPKGAAATTPEAVSPGLAAAVLEQVAHATCPSQDSSKVEQQGTVYRFACIPAAGHSTDVSIEQFAGQPNAHSAFADAIGDHPVQNFHGYPSSQWNALNPAPPDAKEIFWYWQAGWWVFTVHSFDDTGLSIAPGVADVSDALYQAAMHLGLLDS